jgi:hypothetical protein
LQKFTEFRSSNAARPLPLTQKPHGIVADLSRPWGSVSQAAIRRVSGSRFQPQDCDQITNDGAVGILSKNTRCAKLGERGSWPAEEACSQGPLRVPDIRLTA